MINYLLKTFIRKKLKTNKIRNVDELFYYQNIYPTYLETAKDFEFAIKNNFLNHNEVVHIKNTIDDFIFYQHHSKDYRHFYSKSLIDAIYTKLQCKFLTKKQLEELDEYITNIIIYKCHKLGTFVPSPNISQP